ncbi:hypothetical protein FRC09_005648, partial [Ceratobasidium sp. 395]
MSTIASCAPVDVSRDSVASRGGPIRHPYFCLENEMVAIQVENTLFNVHKQQFSVERKNPEFQGGKAELSGFRRNTPEVGPFGYAGFS